MLRPVKRMMLLLVDPTVPGSCISGWDVTLQPLLAAPQGSCDAAAQRQAAAWIDGSTCTTAQKQIASSA